MAGTGNGEGKGRGRIYIEDGDVQEKWEIRGLRVGRGSEME